MADLQIQGKACDLACCEIAIQGRPLARGFSSFSFKSSLTGEKIFQNGSVDAVDRTEGKAELESAAEMPYKHFMLLHQELGGDGEDGHEYQRTEFEVTLTFRPKGDPSIYVVTLEACRIKDDDTKNEHGSPSMVSLTLDPMRIRRRIAQ